MLSVIIIIALVALIAHLIAITYHMTTEQTSAAPISSRCNG